MKQEGGDQIKGYDNRRTASSQTHTRTLIIGDVTNEGGDEAQVQFK